MGVYSSNRLSALNSYNEEAEDIKDTKIKIDPDVEALEDEDYKIGEGVVVRPNVLESFDGLLEYSILIDENDNSMFEALITSDLLEECRKQTLQEESVKGIEGFNAARLDNIKKGIDKVMVGTISGIYSEGITVAASCASLMHEDKKTYNKYYPLLEEHFGYLVENFSGIKNFYYPKVTVEEVSDISDIVEAAERAVEKIVEATTREEVVSALSRYEHVMNECSDIFHLKIKKTMEKKSVWIPTLANLRGIEESYTNGAIDKNAENICNTLYEAVDNMRTNILESVSKLNENTDMDVYKAYAAYKVSSYTAKAVNRLYKASSDCLVRETAALRSALLVCGKFIQESLKDSILDEATIYSICESSEAYIFDYFEETSLKDRLAYLKRKRTMSQKKIMHGKDHKKKENNK